MDVVFYGNQVTAGEGGLGKRRHDDLLLPLRQLAGLHPSTLHLRNGFLVIGRL